jgi:hypothetical protein
MILLRREEQNGFASRFVSGRPANPVQIGLHVLRTVTLDDPVHRRDVQASRRDVCSEKSLDFI